MTTYDVSVRCVAVRTERVRAASPEEAEEIALERAERRSPASWVLDDDLDVRYVVEVRP